MYRAAMIMVFCGLAGAAASGYTGNFTYVVSGSTIRITGYVGIGGDASIPAAIDGTNVTNIGDYAFRACTNLTNLVVGANVTSMGYNPFSGCDSLLAISVNSNNASYSSWSGVLFDKNQTTIAAYPCRKSGSYVIPSGVIGVRELAFSRCADLTSVAIPASVSSIEGNVFRGSDSLITITVDSSNATYSSLSGVLYNKGQTTIIAYPGGRSGAYTIPDNVTSIGYSAFASCTSLTEVATGTNITSIGPYAFFECSDLSSVTIPDGVTYINSSVFAFCSSLRSLTIPESVKHIIDGAFGGCTALRAVYFKGDAPSCGICVFLYDEQATVFYRTGTTGWGATFGNRPTALWPEFASVMPEWWILQGVIGFNSIPNDYAAANQGQLKNVATAAYDELLAVRGSVSTGILDVISCFTQSNNYVAVNVGQVKTVAAPFYDFLSLSYPWTGTKANDYAVANIGQIKNAFSFQVATNAP